MKTSKKILSPLILITLLLASCHSASYRFSPISSQHTVAFDRGQWVFHSEHRPGLFGKDAAAQLYEAFAEQLGNRLTDSRSIRTLSHTTAIPFNPNREQILGLKNYVDSDYFVHVKFSEAQSDMPYRLTAQSTQTKKNTMILLLEIYDLNSSEIINIQEVTGATSVEADHAEDWALVPTNEKMARKAVKKVMKRLRG